MVMYDDDDDDDDVDVVWCVGGWQTNEQLHKGSDAHLLQTAPGCLVVRFVIVDVLLLLLLLLQCLTTQLGPCWWVQFAMNDLDHVHWYATCHGHGHHSPPEIERRNELQIYQPSTCMHG
jgi:hypothetical protein